MYMATTKVRLKDLQRTVDTLQGRVEDMQLELRRAQRRSLAERWWKNFMRTGQGDAFMSACCNRRVRPNTKMVDYVGTRSEE